MLARTVITGATWTLADQALVSLGTFLVNVILARGLPPAEFGVYALIYGALLTLQLLPASVLFYPLSVKLNAIPVDRRPRLVGTCLLLTMATCVPLSFVIGGVLVAAGRSELVVPVVAFFVLWQVQEGLRRSLFSDFRHRSSLPGDAISYIGQAIIVLFLSTLGPLDLASCMYVMAITSGFAALVQASQITIALPDRAFVFGTAAQFWRIGRWSFANNLVSIARIQVFPWTLVWLSGAAAVATFQAAFNVANLVNPIMIGLCNVIPQTAARAHPRGKRDAWLAARPFVWIGVPPTFAYCAVALAVPTVILAVVYGRASVYVEAADPLRLLVAAWMLGYAADMACSYLHGVEAAKVAFLINAFGAAAAFGLALPFVASFGLVGACVAMVIASAVRLAVSQVLFARTVASDERVPG